MQPHVENSSEIASDEITFLDVLVGFVANWRLLLITPALCGLAALGVTFFIPPTYKATTTLLPPSTPQTMSGVLAAQLGPLAGLVGSPVSLKNPTDQYVALLKSRTVIDVIIDRFDLRVAYDTPYMEDTRKELLRRLTAVSGAKDGIISISVEDNDPRKAANIANAFVEELRNLSKKLAITEAGQRRLFFDEQLKKTRDNLTRSELALRGSGISEAALKTMPQSAIEALAKIRAQITAQEIKLASMRTFMTESNPEFRLAAQELLALRTELSKVERSNTSRVAGDGAEYIPKYRDFKYHEALFELMAKQYEIARLDEAREGAVIQVIDIAHIPEKKSKPQKVVISMLTALAAFVLIVFFLGIRRSIAGPPPDSSGATSALMRLFASRRT